MCKSHTGNWKGKKQKVKKEEITFLLKHSFFFIFKVICPYGLISRLALSEVLFSNLNVFFFVYFFNNYALEGYIWCTNSSHKTCALI